MYGEKDSLPPIQKEILYQKKIKLSERLPQRRDLVALEIKYIEDLSLFYINSIIKKFYPFILKIQSQNSIHELKDNINFTSDLHRLYSHNELAILFNNIPFSFLLNSNIKYTNIVGDITDIDKNEAFEEEVASGWGDDDFDLGLEPTGKLDMENSKKIAIPPLEESEKSDMN